jgi:hypothetical protein
LREKAAISFVPVRGSKPGIGTMFKHRMRESVAVLCWLFGTGLAAPAQDNSVDALVRAYPNFLVSHDEKVLTWKDGTQMLLSDGHLGWQMGTLRHHALRVPAGTPLNPRRTSVKMWPISRGLYQNNERAPDMARRSKPGLDFVISGHCTISMKAQVWRRPSTRESITLPHSPPHRRPRLVPV